MRIIIFEAPDGTPFTARLVDEETGKELKDVSRIEFFDLKFDTLWEGRLHFDEHSGKEPEEVYLKTRGVG